MALNAFKTIPLPIPQLSLAAVLKCGQSFRWTTLTPTLDDSDASPTGTEPSPTAVEYRICLKDRVVCLRQSPDTLYYRSIYPDPQPPSSTLHRFDAETLEWLKDYFQLKIDLVSLYKEWAAKDSVFAGFQDRFEGIRILRQDPWENLVSFICSSNNNISRITKMVQNLCMHYSPPLLSDPHPFIPGETLTYHPFPPPSALAPSGVGLRLRSLGFGYRADYIQRTAQMLVDEHRSGTPKSTSLRDTAEASELWLRQLRKMKTSDARDELLKFVGVGRKVADCILLMSMDKKEVVPVDTHVYQIAVKHYGLKSATGGKPNMTPKLYEQVNAKFFSIWGDYAGWAHTVLFTADLKSFSSYGLNTPPSQPLAGKSPKKKSKTTAATLDIGIPTPPLTPGPSPLKRSRESDKFEEEDPMSMSISQLCEETSDSLSLADRVKKRRRRSYHLLQ
ncbi:hypothetical protein NLJ89_g6401 [Agrocybe chaxingu]|uniref:DNA-(apurinic or apyrimidinic site) lyase n=1 Tax=Agrocybe chaxingu TaxID=84603 RepID=A0A9W8K5L6_9AGAR|nr:hypothetical protein NLJ89_g6401 [Agrocybe chaxingu]